MKEQLLHFCRYYKGEEDCPKGTKNSFWNYEKIWVENTLENNEIYFSHLLDEYLAYGLSDFNISDNVPITLKALLFNRYSHWSRINIEDFKSWYLMEYYQV